MAITFGRLVIKGEGTFTTKSSDILITWSGYHTKLDREVASDENMLLTKLDNLLITWTHQVTGETENIISPFPQNTWPLN